jgi:hypothetical protein
MTALLLMKIVLIIVQIITTIDKHLDGKKPPVR